MKFNHNKKNYIENKYKKDGYYNTKVNINSNRHRLMNQVNMLVALIKDDKNSKIDFVGTKVIR
jgi:outer membrane protein insertion porin family